jgi:hypothetical protein
MRTFPIPSKPAPSGGEDKPKARDTDQGDDTAPAYAKGGNVQAASYAEGGPVLGRTREFMKEASPFRSSVDGIAPANQRPIAAGGAPGEPTNSYPKKGKGEQGKDKSLKTVMPRT